MSNDASPTQAAEREAELPASDVDSIDAAEREAGHDGATGETSSSPPSFGKQVAQLVIITAVIAIAGILIVTMFGVLAPKAAEVEDLVAKIAQPGGVGKIGPFSDPRNSERYRAAATLSQMLREHRAAEVREPGSGELTAEQLTSIHQSMVELLTQEGPQVDGQLHAMAVFIVGQAGQAGGFDAIVSSVGRPEPLVRQFAIKAMLVWPDQTQAKAERERVQPLLTDSDPAVRVEAARALGALSSPQDESTIAALRDAMLTSDGESRDLRWNAAIALARLGDPAGSVFVADVLLNRDALAQLPAEETGPGATRTMPKQAQDQVIWLTLHAVDDMTHAAVWDRIERLSETDPNAAIVQKAGQLMDGRSSRD